MRQFRPFHLAALIIVSALYVAVRFWGLTSSCLWFDEIFSVHAAEHPWNELFSFVALDLIHPPLFYVLLKIWIGIGGDGLLWLRLFPVIFSVIAVVPLMLLCRELSLTFWTRVLALFFLAVNGCLIKYAQEVRMYSFLFCLSLFSMWLFARFFIKGKSFIALVIVNLLMVYTHYFGWFVVVAEVSAILGFQRIKRRQAVAMFAILLACFLPWACAIWNAERSGSAVGQNIGWMTRPELAQTIQFILDLVEPFYYQASSVDAMSVYRVSVPMLLMTIVSFAFYFDRSSERPADEKQTRYLLILFAAVPVGTAFILSWLLPYSIWGTRHLIVVFAPFSILLATAIINIPMQAVRTASVTLILLFSGFGFVDVARAPLQIYSWCNWDPLGVRASEKYQGRIYVFEDVVAYHLWFAIERKGDQTLEVTKIKDMPGVNEDAAYFLPRGFDAIRTVEFSEVKEPRVWIAYRSVGIDETREPLKTFIDAGYTVVDRTILPANSENTILLLLKKGS